MWSPALLLSTALVLAQVAWHTTGKSTTNSTPTKLPSTATPVGTSNHTGTSPVEEITTTAETTAESSTSKETTTTTTTTAAQTTTPVAPSLGGNCTTTDLCNSSITGNAVCVDSVCACSDTYFKLNATMCLPVDDLTPGSITVTSQTPDSLNFNWKSPQAVKYNVSVDYTVTCHSLSNLSAAAVLGIVQELEGSCTGLTPGDRYQVSVVVSHEAYNQTTNSTVVNMEPAVPGKINSMASSLAAPNVTLVWFPADGIVDQYQVTVNGEGGGLFSQTNNVTVFGLDPGTTYNVSITGWSNNVTSQPSQDQFSTVTTVPGAPTNPTAVAMGVDTIMVGWGSPGQPNGDIVGYNINISRKLYSDEEFTFFRDPFNETKVTNVNVTGLTPGAFYLFEIYTLNDEFISNTSANVIGSTNEATPGNVTDLQVQASNSSLTVTWKRPMKPNGNITRYRVEWVEANETCHVTIGLNNNTTKTENCSHNAAVAMEKDQKEMEYTIKGLKPFTNYTVTVTPFTSVGRGDPVSRAQQTSVIEPEAVDNVTAVVLNSTNVNVTWEIADTNPGPVTYTVMVVDRVWNNTSDGCSVEVDLPSSYRSKFCVQTDLKEFWPYQFFVRASTSAGDQNSSSTNVITTGEGVPGEVSSVSYSLLNLSSNCDATQALVTWTEPGLEDRNAKITSYIIKNSQTNVTVLNHHVSDPQPYRNTSALFTGTVTSLQAETRTYLEIVAITEGRTQGQSKNFNITTSNCAPPDWIDGDTISLVSQTTSTITMSLPTGFFNDATQGAITDRGLVVSQEELMDSPDDLESYESWQDIQGTKSSYAIKPTELGSPKKKVEEVTIGSDSSCTAASPGFCNGPLPEDTEFYVTAVTCTGLGAQKKCIGSEPFGPFSTLETKNSGGGSGVSGGIVGAIVALFVAISFLVFALLWFRGAIDPPTWCKRGDDGVDPDPLPPAPIVPHRPIILSNYQNALKELHRDTNLMLSDQYNDIFRLTETIKEKSSFDASNLEPNKAKNRWVNVLPYDHSRVKLQQLDDDDSTSDYINANYMPGFNNRREYIATQGPLPGTIDDFWRMIWEQNVKVIVMLTQCKEGNRVKCEMYWPDQLHEAKQYGEVIVNPISISPLDKYNITIFELIVNNQKQTVMHLHYLEFPDMTANVEFDSFIDFLHIARSHVPHDMESPILVHCSAGVGRTGTFIILDRLLQYLASPQFSWGDTVDVFAMVMTLREQRVLMVQTESQYIMIHDCLSKILEEKKAAEEVTDEEEEHMYGNQAFVMWSKMFGSLS